MVSAIVTGKHLFSCGDVGIYLCRRKHSSFAKTASVFNPDDLLPISRNTHSTTHASLLRSSGIAGALSDGRQVHSCILNHGLEKDSFLGNLLVQMYARCLDIGSVQFCFHRIESRNVFSWNFLIGAYDGLGQHKEVLHCFVQMQAENVIPDKVTFVHVLSAYASSPANLLQGKWLHACLLCMRLDLNCILATALFNMYDKCSDLELARSTFKSMPERDLASWNAVIAFYALQGQHTEALYVYEQLRQESFLPDDITSVNILTACARPMALTYGKRIHASIHYEDLEKNTILGTALANMYGKCSCLKQAQLLFEKMSVRNVVTWNAMIAVYAQHYHGKEAMQLFKQMQQEGVAINSATFVGLLDSCARERLLDAGRTIHTWLTKYGFDSDVMVGTALVNMYNKCISLPDGQTVFRMLPMRNVVSWNAMMTGYVHLGQGKDALEIFDQMQDEKVTMDNMTASVALSACALESSLARGKRIHSIILQSGIDLDFVVKNSIVNMYGKCGCVSVAQNEFEIMPEKNLVSWNCILALHAQHGNWIDVFEHFLKMQCHGMVPNETSLTSIISACSHAGLVSECSCLWFSITLEHNVLPSIDHLDCMVDLVGRVGKLDEAEYFMNNMPIQPRALSWTTLLAACKCSGDVLRGKLAARSRVELEMGDPYTYITLSNIYVASGMKENADKLMDCLLNEDLELLALPSIKMEIGYKEF